MFIIGVTGSLKTGKSTVSALFAELGVKVLDADKIVHRLLNNNKECSHKIIREFGDDIGVKGKIERRKLAEIVFKDVKKLRRLEKIIHPFVRKEIIERIKFYQKQQRVKAVVLDVPLLFESKLKKEVDYTVVVKATQKEQIKRAGKQRQISQADALRRIRQQMPLKEKVRRADFVIDNSGTKTKLKKQVVDIWQKMLQMEKK
ncbi:MAG: dephospho-CoA kinase [Candidatus Omnitrophica bacterium]|nr:dephospho-CoA kinase [Candidatus Omnitrophota bacterium]